MIQLNRKTRWLAGFLFLLLGGCASTPQSFQLIDHPPDIPNQIELTQTGFFPQLEFHCGPAALATVMQLRGVEVSPSEIAKHIYIPELQGSFQAELVAATRHYNLIPVELNGRLDSLLTEVASGNPVLVMQNLGLESYPQWHYAVVVGYDLDQQQIILRSGEVKRLVRSFKLFERTWQRANHWALSIDKPEKIPVTASAEQFIAPLIDLEQLGKHSVAYSGYLSAIKRWPDNTIVRIGGGNTAYALERFVDARQHYQQGLELEPDNISILNNLAYVEMQLENRTTAIELIRKARALQPENDNLRDSELEILNWK